MEAVSTGTDQRDLGPITHRLSRQHLPQSNIPVEQSRPLAALKVLAACAEAHPKESYLQLLIGQVNLSRGAMKKAQSALERATGAKFENTLSKSYATNSLIRASVYFSLAQIVQERNDVLGFRRIFKARRA